MSQNREAPKGIRLTWKRALLIHVLASYPLWAYVWLYKLMSWKDELGNLTNELNVLIIVTVLAPVFTPMLMIVMLGIPLLGWFGGESPGIGNIAVCWGGYVVPFAILYFALREKAGNVPSHSNGWA